MTELPESASLQVGLALALGIVAQIVARHFRVPGIVVLLAVGVATGPDGLGLLQPAVLGHGLDALVGFAVAVVLFEGGMALDLAALRHQAVAVRRLVTLGALVTAVGGTLATRLSLDWSWAVALLFGTLVIVTGPTVVNPLLKRIRVVPRVATVLEGEGILGDAVGATIAVVTLEILLAPASDTLYQGLVGLLGRLGFGVCFGVVSGAAIDFALRGHRLVPHGLRNVFALALLVCSYGLANALQSESGVLTAIVAGMWVGNRRRGELVELREFKEELTVLLIGMLFVLLAADVRLAEVAALGGRGVLVVLALMFAVRPLSVLVATRGSGLGWRERAFLASLAPRGIVAAAVASHFAHSLAAAGIAGGAELRALVFLVIAVTVTAYGLAGGLVARALGVAEPLPTGWAIAGANPLARAVGGLLAARGEVTLLDANADLGAEARAAGWSVVVGNALDEEVLGSPEVSRRRSFLGLTPNEEVNFLFARRVRELAREAPIAIALRRDHTGIDAAMLAALPASVLFDGPRRIDLWALRLERGLATIRAWEATAEAPELPASGRRTAWLPLVVERGRDRRPWLADLHPRRGDHLWVLVLEEEGEEVAAAWSAAGWRVWGPEEPGRAREAGGGPLQPA